MAAKPKLSVPVLLQASKGPYRMLLGYLHPYRGRFFLGLLCGVGFALLNACIPLVIYFVAQHVFGASQGAGGEAPAVKLPGPLAGMAEKVSMPDWLEITPGLGGVLIACIMIPAIMIIRSLLSYGNSYCMAWVSFKMLRDLRLSLFSHIISQSLDFFNRAKSGKLISRIANDTRVAQSAFVSVAADIFRDPIAVVSGVAVLFILDWKFCLVTMILFPVCLVPIAIFGRKVRKAGKAEEDEAGAMAVIMHETFAGIRVIKSFAREPYQIAQFDRSSAQQFRNSMRVRKSMEVVQPLIETVSAFGIALALLYIFFFQVEVSKVIALLLGTFLLYEPMKKLSRIHMLMQKALAASTNVFNLMQETATIQDRPGATVPQNCRGEIEFDHVSFSYGSDVQALHGISLKVQAGKQYALVGASGAGKSTMLSLLLRFYDPQEGRILLDGTDIRDLRQEALRENIGIVTQETFLFHDTIYENIRYGRLDATREEIIQAAKLAYAHDFIMAQPDGYDTIIGDKGCLLSGGQQQRLSIARAILKDAPVLLLDEATSALDSESERMIQSALERLTQGKTVIAIAHRLSTILKSDQIVVMEHGRIVEVGSHRQLLADSVVYRKLYEMQFHHEEAEQDVVDPLAVNG